jgi:WD40 repeat protein
MATNELTLLTWDAGSRRMSAPIPIGDARSLDQSPLKLNALAVSADGSTAAGGPITSAFARLVGAVTVWDAATGRPRFTRPDGGITAFNLSPDGRRLVTVEMVRGSTTPGAAAGFGNLPHALQVWDAQTGAEVATLGKALPAVARITFSPDGRRIAFVVRETSTEPGEIRVVDAASGAAVATMSRSNPKATVGAIAFSPDGTRLAAALSLAAPASTGAVAQSVGLWSVDDGKEIWASPAVHLVTAIIRHDQLSVAFSPAGTEIVAAFADRTLRVLEAATGREDHRLVGHTGDIYAVAYSPDGSGIVSAAADQTVRVWNPRPGEPARALDAPQAGPMLRGVHLSGDGRTLLALTGKAQPANATLDTLPAWALEGWSLATGTRLFATAPQSKNDAVLWTMFNYDGPSAGGRFAILPGTIDIDRGSGNRAMRYALRVFDTTTGAGREPLLQERLAGTEVADSRAVRPATADVAIPSGVVVSTSGARALATFARLASSNQGAPAPGPPKSIQGHQVDVWDVPAGRRISTIDLGNPRVEIMKVVLSPDATRAVLMVRTVGGGRREATDYPVYDLATSQRVCVLRGSDGAALPLVFSPDGASVAAPDAENVVSVWNARTGERRHAMSIGTRVGRLAFSPDGSRLLVLANDGAMTLWNTATGNHVLTIPASEAPQRLREFAIAASVSGYVGKWLSLSFTPDGRQIELAAIAPDKSGARIQLKTWDGSPAVAR